MKRIFTLILIFAAINAYADFKDYRAFSGNETPAQFEYSLDTAALYPGSAIIFTEGYPLMWEADNVSAVFMSGGEITAAAQNGIVYLANGVCGGLMVPEGTDNLYYNGEILIASAGKRNYFYYVPYCAQYRDADRSGIYMAAAGDLLCEAGFRDITVSDIVSGRVLYSQETDSIIKAVHASENACYYLDGNGRIEKYTRDAGLASRSYISDSRILAATAHDTGFSGFTGNYHFNLTIDEKGTLLEFDRLPSTGYCFVADRSSEIFCDIQHKESFAATAYSAEKVMLSRDMIYLYGDQKLTAHARKAGWVQEFLPSYKEPVLYSDNDELYFQDVLGTVYRLSGMWPQKYHGAVPKGAIPVPGGYRDGAVFSPEGQFLWLYAELIRQDGNKSVYKSEQSGRVIYLTLYQ